MKKIIALALALIMVLSMGTVAFAATTVSDAAALQAAFTAGEDVVLGGNIEVTSTLKLPVGKTVELDLAGYKISGSGINPLIHVANTATLNITDSSDDKSGVIELASGSLTYAATIHLEGNLNLYAGTISMDGTPDIGYAVDIRPNAWGSEYTEGSVFHMYDGTLKSGESAVRVSSSSSTAYENVSATFIMDDGKMDGARDGVFVQAQNATYPILNVEINNGEVEGGNNAVRVYGPAATGAVGDAENPITVSLDGGEYSGKVVFKDTVTTDSVDMAISGGTFDVAPPAEYVTADADITVTTGETNPGKEIVVSTAYDRADWKVKSYDFTTGTRGFNGASYIDEIKITKENKLVIVLKDNYKLAEDKLVKGEIILQNKETKAEVAVPVFYTVANNVAEVYGSTKAKDATDLNDFGGEKVFGDNCVIIMDEDGGYVKFQEEMLAGTVKMNADEKTFLNLIYGVDTKTEDTIDAIEELLGEEYVDEAIIEYYTFETRAFKNEVAFSYEAYEDDPHYFYLYNDGKLTKIDAKYNDDEEVEAWEWTAIAEGTIIVTDVEIVLADETTKNPDTGANDVVGVAAALAVVSVISAAAVAIKK